MTSPLALQTRLTLTGVAPPIWRRLLVPTHIHLGQLHDVIQCAMGWTDSHLHEFEIGGRRYGLPMPEYDEPGNRVFQERKAKLGDLAGRVGDRFSYTYDFGDNWQHEIVVEEILPGDSERPTAECIAGERSCPPEDIGGVYGYAGFLEAIADPSHEDHEHYLELKSGCQTAAGGNSSNGGGVWVRLASIASGAASPEMAAGGDAERAIKPTTA